MKKGLCNRSAHEGEAFWPFVCHSARSGKSKTPSKARWQGRRAGRLCQGHEHVPEVKSAACTRLQRDSFSSGSSSAICPFTAALRTGEGLKVSTRRGLIGTSTPVRGLRPRRSRLLRTERGQRTAASPPRRQRGQRQSLPVPFRKFPWLRRAKASDRSINGVEEIRSCCGFAVAGRSGRGPDARGILLILPLLAAHIGKQS